MLHFYLVQAKFLPAQISPDFVDDSDAKTSDIAATNDHAYSTLSPVETTFIGDQVPTVVKTSPTKAIKRKSSKKIKSAKKVVASVQKPAPKIVSFQVMLFSQN